MIRKFPRRSTTADRRLHRWVAGLGLAVLTGAACTWISIGGSDEPAARQAHGAPHTVLVHLVLA